MEDLLGVSGDALAEVGWGVGEVAPLSSDSSPDLSS